ncbi:unnamed protein product, partial [Musa acuminata subsp. burmannicoides]
PSACRVRVERCQTHPVRGKKEELEVAAIKKSPSRRFWTAAVSLPTATNPSPFALFHRLSLDSILIKLLYTWMFSCAGGTKYGRLHLPLWIQPLFSNDNYDVTKFKCETSSSSPA